MRALALLVLFVLMGCASGGDTRPRDGGGGIDAGPVVQADGGSPDAGAPHDGGPVEGATACTPETAAVVCEGRPCVDGFCCDTPCTGTCRSCAIPGLEGICNVAGAGTDPDDECPDQAPATCGTTGSCDGDGRCALHGASVACDDGQACTDGDACDGAGTCRGAAPSECAPAAGNECCLGSCGAGGCSTEAGICADRCDANELTIGRACAGCGAPRAAGACMGGGVHTCNATSHSACQELTCGGVTYYCTNDGGVWQWRTGARCDDGDACTHSDSCSAGACTGAAVSCASTTCMARSCNGTATCTETPRTGPCDDGDPCSYNDACNAAGVCASSSRITCTSSACIDRACTGGPTCMETIRTGASCDDGNACSYGESCTAAGACTGGSAISCDGMDTTCRDFSCNGTSSCGSAPRNVGGACDDGNAATTGDVCRADGTCAGSVGCPLPADACTNGTQSRDRCSGARVIGRAAAAATGGFVITGSTCSASNRFDDCSWDAGNDHAYRMWMRAGETASIRIERTDTCYSGWSATLKIYESTGCTDVTCANDILCEDFIGSSPHSYTRASGEGWVVIVVDGSTAFDDEGQYRLTVQLTNCRVAGCEC